MNLIILSIFQTTGPSQTNKKTFTNYYLSMRTFLKKDGFKPPFGCKAIWMDVFGIFWVGTRAKEALDLE